MNLKRKNGLIFTAVFAGLFCLITTGAWCVFNTPPAKEPDKKDLTLDQRIQWAKTSLVNGRDMNTGIFIYSADLLRGYFFYNPNMVRNALGVLALGEYLYFFDSTDAAGRQAMKDVLSAYQKLSKPIGPNAAVLTSIDFPVEAAETGATANALMGALYYKYAVNDDHFDSLIEQWKNGLLKLYKNNEGFKERPDSDQEDPFFNGESWSALTLYYGFTKDKEVLEVLEKLLAYMPKKYQEFDPRFFHWGLRAASFSLQNGLGVDVLPGFIEYQTEKFLTSRFVDVKPFIDCGALEGLGSALEWLKPGELNQKTQRFFIESMNFNHTAQIIDGFKRADGSFVALAPGMDAFKGVFMWDTQGVVTQIDATTHCLSSMLLQKKLMKAGKL